MSEKNIPVSNQAQLSGLFGSFDSNISRIEKEYNVTVVYRDENIRIIGQNPEQTDSAGKAINALINQLCTLLI